MGLRRIGVETRLNLRLNLFKLREKGVDTLQDGYEYGAKHLAPLNYRREIGEAPTGVARAFFYSLSLLSSSSII